MLWCNLTHCRNNQALLQYGSVRRCLCVFFSSCTHKLYSSCTRVRPPDCLAGASFSLYFIQETFTQTYSKWCISGGPHRWALPPHLYRVCLFPPGNDFQSSFAVNHWLRGYFLSFSCHFQLLVVKCLCWQCMVAPAEWKKGFRKLYHLCPALPKPNRQFSMLQRSHGFTEHRIQKPNRTEIVRSQGWKVSKHCRIFLGDCRLWSSG